MTRKLISCAGLFAAALVAVSAAPPELASGQDKKKGGGGPKHVFSCPPPDHPFDVILARPTDTSVTVSVLAYRPTDAYITFGTEAGKLTGRTDTRPLAPDAPAEFVLKGLKADTRYQYRIHTRPESAKEFVTDAERTFHTQRKPGSPFVFTTQSDSHLDQGTRAAVYELSLANALKSRPDFHIDIGDTFMTDKFEKHTDAAPQYVAQRYFFGRIAHSAPLFLVLGNHDGERGDRYDGTADCMPVWSAARRKKLFPNPSPDGFYTGNKTEIKHVGTAENYFAWEWGDALFVALDPFWPTTTRPRKGAEDGNWARTLGKEQYDWLGRTLAGSKAKFKFVFIHHLVGGVDDSGRGGSEAAALYEWGGKGKTGKDEFKAKRPGWDVPIHQLMVKHKVSVVFHGHDHFYAHQELDDVKYVMVPQPGHPGGERLRGTDEYGYIRGDFLPPAGHVRVSVTPEKATVEYVRSLLPAAETPKQKNGHVAHTFTLRPAP
ncbi:MAG: metallophosphoesterase [Gemmata sp.]